MSRSKPKEWHAPSIEQLSVQDVWPMEKLRSLVYRHLGSVSDKRMTVLVVDLTNVLGIFRAGLHLRKMPTEGSVRAALIAAKTSIANAQSHLKALDDRSRDRILDAARADVTWRADHPFDCPMGSSDHVLQNLVTWIKAALKATGRDSPGAIYLDCERHAVRGLLRVWG